MSILLDLVRSELYYSTGWYLHVAINNMDCEICMTFVPLSIELKYQNKLNATPHPILTLTLSQTNIKTKQIIMTYMLSQLFDIIGYITLEQCHQNNT